MVIKHVLGQNGSVRYTVGHSTAPNHIPKFAFRARRTGEITLSNPTESAKGFFALLWAAGTDAANRPREFKSQPAG